MPNFWIFSTLAFIFSFSARSSSASLLVASTLNLAPKIFTLSVSIEVLAIRIFAFFKTLAWPTPNRLSKINPSSRNESDSLPPTFLMIWIRSRFVEPPSLRMASTASLAKYSLSCDKILDDKVVLAISVRSFLNLALSSTLLTAKPSSSFKAARDAILTVTDVVPSPTSSSCTLATLTNTLAAGLSNGIAFKIVAPSLVTNESPEEADCKSLSIPLGPKVDFTKSPTAMAPTNDDSRAFSARSSVTWSPKILTDIKEKKIGRKPIFPSTRRSLIFGQTKK
ncbi:hypothetical protein OGAPHI_003888 [Ogataea philodendri]|uniref:Secreted protein n=1 Tax=Ogataea philodendri TaxID=1378263 RepID=A0A9P8P5Q4_9ASCO|nr:uncharacterized protein OGAPHI_003888 [Ogataea philodendri]KAH3665700.1 hypothetical protein OGAPHI_003888 [Ogataea philodendri]